MHKVTLRFAQDATDDDKKLFLDTLRDCAQDARLIEDEYADGPECRGPGSDRTLD